MTDRIEEEIDPVAGLRLARLEQPANPARLGTDGDVGQEKEVGVEGAADLLRQPELGLVVGPAIGGRVDLGMRAVLVEDPQLHEVVGDDRLRQGSHPLEDVPHVQRLGQGGQQGIQSLGAPPAIGLGPTLREVGHAGDSMPVTASTAGRLARRPALEQIASPARVDPLGLPAQAPPQALVLGHPPGVHGIDRLAVGPHSELPGWLSTPAISGKTTSERKRMGKNAVLAS